MNNSKEFTSAEAAAKELCAIYRGRGYRHYRMSKFEEYDFYAKNKNFLVSSNIITFTDLDGKLMALKPDVTLSIIKNARWGKGSSEKVYYTEKVYRPEKGAREFREITQTGLECVGDLSFYDIAEVVSLAVKSLRAISGEYVLALSHMGFMSGLLAETGADEEVVGKLLSAVSDKNTAALRAVCREEGLAEYEESFARLTDMYLPIAEAVPILRAMSVNEKTEAAVCELESLARILESSNLSSGVNVDFSVVNDMNYYNGIIFRGYIRGIPQGVLSGGSYDSLLGKMGKNANAVGFAIYLDLLSLLNPSARRNDADILITYDPAVSAEDIAAAADKFNSEGYSVRVQKEDDGSVGAEQKIHITEKGELARGDA